MKVVFKNRPTYLTEVEVAEMTRRALSTLRNDRFYRRGIPYIKVGRSVRYDLRDVIAFMEAGKIVTGPCGDHLDLQEDDKPGKGGMSSNVRGGASQNSITKGEL
jgi:hypothetical protein